MRVIDACMRKAEAVARGGKVKTLRDEWFEGRTSVGTMAQRYVNERFLDRYGDYRVVEGRLTTKCGHRKGGNTRIVIVGKGVGASECWTEVGYTGDIVTLILPPEEKELSLDGAREQILEAQLEATRGREFQERDRADRYEKALREIAAARWPQLVYRDTIELHRKLAREALDE